MHTSRLLNDRWINWRPKYADYHLRALQKWAGQRWPVEQLDSQKKGRAPLSLHPVCTRLAYLVYTPYTHISRWGCCTSVPASIESCQDPCCPLDEWPLDPLDLAISCAVNFCSITIIIFNVCSGPIHSPRFAWLAEIFTDFSPEFFLGVLPVGEPHLIQ